jgi:hypothetical protein
MEKDKLTVKLAKPIYQSPKAMQLTDTRRGVGDCESGSGDEKICTNGNSPGTGWCENGYGYL